MFAQISAFLYMNFLNSFLGKFYELSNVVLVQYVNKDLVVNRCDTECETFFMQKVECV